MTDERPPLEGAAAFWDLVAAEGGSMDLGLKDKVILITGGTSGIGRATAEMAVAEGARVFVLARHEVNVPGCEFVSCDVTSLNIYVNSFG